MPAYLLITVGPSPTEATPLIASANPEVIQTAMRACLSQLEATTPEKQAGHAPATAAPRPFRLKTPS